jgi:membrane protein DedA with SNARE-associated domain
MFGILFLCGIGLPIPEEVTLLASGLFVGWKEADFLYSSVSCVSAILIGDSIIFFVGRMHGQKFLDLIVSKKKQAKAARSFENHRLKTVFFARFFAGLRIGVYGYAGAHGMSWFKFVVLDFLGALISGPTSIWLGKIAAESFADNPSDAIAKAQEFSHEFKVLIFVLVAAVVAGIVTFYVLRRKNRVDLRRAALEARAATRQVHTSGREVPPGV